jgi:predicted  nucleic acid-binding Zn-ribbon protein
MDRLIESISRLVQALDRDREQREREHEWLKAHSGVATKYDLQQLEHKIMSAISDFTDKQNAFNNRIDTAITDLQGDVKSLTDQITALQNSAGTITPEDQALLDGIQQRTSTIADKLDALDALTPPAVPPTTA